MSWLSQDSTMAMTSGLCKEASACKMSILGKSLFCCSAFSYLVIVMFQLSNYNQVVETILHICHLIVPSFSFILVYTAHQQHALFILIQQDDPLCCMFGQCQGVAIQLHSPHVQILLPSIFVVVHTLCIATHMRLAIHLCM